MTDRDTPSRPGSEIPSLWAAGGLGRRTQGPPEVVFAQVREDTAVETAAFAACERREAAFCIGSGGCTALSLLTAHPAAVYAVDINPAQIHLLELKRSVFIHLSYDDVLASLTADARPAYPTLRPYLPLDAREFWDRRSHRLSRGLNQCGILDRKLARAMRLFLPLALGRRRIEAMFQQPDLDAQRSFYRRRWNNARWHRLFRWGLSRPVLRLAYGPQFLDQLPAGFAGLMKEQLDPVFLNIPIRDNGYLWQTFLGRYPPGEAGLPVYLRREAHAELQSRIGCLHLACSDAADWLAGQPPHSLDFFALSNILEVTTPDQTDRLLAALLHAARPGALVCLRSIFPPDPDEFFAYREQLRPVDALTSELSRSDRSPFCRFLRLLRVTN